MQSNKESNQKLIERFPFLIPRNRWTGKIPEDYDYSYTELDSMPTELDEQRRKIMAGERLLGSKCVKISVRNWYVPSISTNTALPRSRRNMERSVGMTLAVQSGCFVTSSPNMSAYLRELASDVGTLQQRFPLAGSVPTVTLVLAKSVMPRDLFPLRNGSIEAAAK